METVNKIFYFFMNKARKGLEKVNIKGLAKELSHMEGLTMAQSERVIKIVFKQILYLVVEKKMVEIPGFGKFFAKFSPARKGSHPQTHETITVGPNVQMKAEFSSTVKKELNKYVDRFAEQQDG